MHKVYYTKAGVFGYVDYSKWCDLTQGIITSIPVKFNNNTILHLTLKDLN